MVASDSKTAVGFLLTTGNAHDAPPGRELLNKVASSCEGSYLLMDRAYEGDETRELAVKLGLKPVVPPKNNRKNPWEYDKEMYKRRNEIERLFRALKGFRRIFTRYDKLDIMFLAFVTFTLIVKTCVNTT